MTLICTGRKIPFCGFDPFLGSGSTCSRVEVLWTSQESLIVLDPKTAEGVLESLRQSNALHLTNSKKVHGGEPHKVAVVPPSTDGSLPCLLNEASMGRVILHARSAIKNSGGQPDRSGEEELPQTQGSRRPLCEPRTWPAQGCPHPEHLPWWRRGRELDHQRSKGWSPPEPWSRYRTRGESTELQPAVQSGDREFGLRSQ